MSQRGPAPRPASRRSSQSSAKDSASSPPYQQRNPRRQDEPHPQPPPHHEHGGFPVNEWDGRNQQQLGNRTSGVHNILNPPDSRANLAGSAPSLSRPPTREGSPRAEMGSGHYGGRGGSPPRHYGFQRQGAVTPQQLGNPMIPSSSATQAPPAPPPSSDRGSPSAVHPYPLTATRRILTPKSPRTSSLGRAASLRSVDTQHLATGLPPHASRNMPPHEVSPLGGSHALVGSHQYPSPIQGQGQAAPPPPPPPPPRPSSGLSRSLSQPSLSHGHPSGSPKEPLPPSKLSRELGGRPTVYSSTSPFSSSVKAGRGGLAASGLLGDRGWGGSGYLGSMSSGSSGSRGLQMTEGHQHLLTITPTHGEEIVVPVDVHQASKQADEKRQRNAGASARFRQRKKEKEKEQQQGMQKLENQNRDLERKIEELEERNHELQAERDFYRNERNRLRDIVARTPGLSEWADRGATSPASSRSVRSFAAPETSPHDVPLSLPHQQLQQQQHQHQHPHQHAFSPHAQSHSHAHPHPHPPPSPYGDPSMLEPPTRRRRTESEPQLSIASYGPNTPTSLPPIPHPGYGVSQPPLLSGSPGSARLPPLRFDQHTLSMSEQSQGPGPGAASAPHPPPLPSQAQQGQTQSGSPYLPYGRAPYETGWVNDPRGPPPGSEGGPR